MCVLGPDSFNLIPARSILDHMFYVKLNAFPYVLDPAT